MTEGHDDLAGGYDARFLQTRLELPAPSAPTVLLGYTHFSVRLLPARRLAAVVGVNINGRELTPLAREGRWHFDARIPRDQQAGPELYRNNDLDRGHLVRRLDPVWGDPVTAKAANQDTFAFTNAAPQVNDFNQGKELWLGLEDHVLGHAAAFDARISVFTGPVFREDDVRYRGVRIPRKFWKIAAWTNQGVLGTAGFILDQSSLLDLAELEEQTRSRLLADEPPPLGPFRTFQVPIELIAGLTGMSLQPLVDADRLGHARPLKDGKREGRHGPAWEGLAFRLESPDQIRL